MKPKDEKTRILTFSDSIFRKKGFYKTSMDEIAGLMKISKKTIYKYYPSKDDLVYASASFMLENSESRVNKIINSEISALDKLVELLSEYSDELMGTCDEWVHDLRQHYPEVWKLIDDFRTKKIHEFAKKLINQGKKEKIIAGYPPEIIVNLYVAGIKAVASPEFLLQNNFSMNKALETVYNIFLNGILTKEGRKIYERKLKL